MLSVQYFLGGFFLCSTNQRKLENKFDRELLRSISLDDCSFNSEMREEAFKLACKFQNRRKSFFLFLASKKEVSEA